MNKDIKTQEVPPDMAIDEKEVIKINEDVAILERPELDEIIAKFQKSLGNTETWQKLTVFYFQCLDKYSDLTSEEIVEKDYLYLMIGLRNPSNPAAIIGVMPIAFKNEILSFRQEDYNQICNMLEMEFPVRLSVYNDKMTVGVKEVKDESSNKEE